MSVHLQEITIDPHEAAVATGVPPFLLFSVFLFSFTLLKWYIGFLGINIVLSCGPLQILYQALGCHISCGRHHHHRTKQKGRKDGLGYALSCFL